MRGVPQNSLRFSKGNFIAYDALGFLSWTFFNSSFRQLFKIVQDFKDWALFDQVMKEILAKEPNKIPVLIAV